MQQLALVSPAMLLGRTAPTKMAVHFSSESSEHYTPDHIWRAAARVMGRIELDPCSNSHTHPNVPADRVFTIEDDGLRQPWEGTVFLNPPYGREIPVWIARLIESYEYQGVSEAIALLPARTDTQWWRMLRDYTVCLVEGRLTFVGNDQGAPFPSAIWYLGQHPDVFCNVFAELGDIWQRSFFRTKRPI